MTKCLHLDLLDSFLADPNDPRWSSAAMDRMFADVEGDVKQRLLTLLPLIDDRLIAASPSLTSEQTHFLRDATLHAYAADAPPNFTLDEIGWLVRRFGSRPTPLRALMIALLVRADELPTDVESTIRTLLVATPGERFL